MCITGFMVHVFLLESMMYVVLIPKIKDKKGKISTIDNYRPVAIASCCCRLLFMISSFVSAASVVSKVVERILLHRLSEYLDTCTIMGNQFGFKPKLEMCIAGGTLL